MTAEDLSSSASASSSPPISLSSLVTGHLSLVTSPKLTASISPKTCADDFYIAQFGLRACKSIPRSRQSFFRTLQIALSGHQKLLVALRHVQMNRKGEKGGKKQWLTI